MIGAAILLAFGIAGSLLVLSFQREARESEDALRDYYWTHPIDPTLESWEILQQRIERQGFVLNSESPEQKAALDAVMSREAKA